MPGWAAGNQTSGAGPSYTVQDVQNRVDAVKGIMQENVEVMLSNLDKTEVLENKSAALADQAKTFHKTARATKRHMCRQNAKMNVIIACICIAILVAILWSVFGWIVPLVNKGDDDKDHSPPPPGVIG